MIQDLFTYASIGIATSYALFSIYKVVLPGKIRQDNSACGCCSGCISKNDHALSAAIARKKKQSFSSPRKPVYLFVSNSGVIRPDKTGKSASQQSSPSLNSP